MKKKLFHFSVEYILRLIIPFKSELPKPNPDSFEPDDTLLTNALMIAEYDFYDTIRIKIGYDMGRTLKNHNLSLTKRSSRLS